eukprot:7556839-Pyramimonas_sp.AAC.1
MVMVMAIMMMMMAMMLMMMMLMMMDLLARTAPRTEAFPSGPAAATLGLVRLSAPSQIHLGAKRPPTAPAEAS